MFSMILVFVVLLCIQILRMGQAKQNETMEEKPMKHKPKTQETEVVRTMGCVAAADADMAEAFMRNTPLSSGRSLRIVS